MCLGGLGAVFVQREAHDGHARELPSGEPDQPARHRQVTALSLTSECRLKEKVEIKLRKERKGKERGREEDVSQAVLPPLQDTN